MPDLEDILDKAAGTYFRYDRNEISDKQTIPFPVRTVTINNDIDFERPAYQPEAPKSRLAAIDGTLDETMFDTDNMNVMQKLYKLEFKIPQFDEQGREMKGSLQTVSIARVMQDENKLRRQARLSAISQALIKVQTKPLAPMAPPRNPPVAPPLAPAAAALAAAGAPPGPGLVARVLGRWGL